MGAALGCAIAGTRASRGEATLGVKAWGRYDHGEDVCGGEAGEQPRGQREVGRDGRAAHAIVVVAAEDRAVVLDAPTVDDAPGERAGAEPANTEAVQLG